MALLIHGDAAFAGEGIVQETLNLSQLRGYDDRRHAARRRQQPDRLHHVARARAARSTYATDVAKMLQIPIFHVNGEDPEAVAQVVRPGDGFPPRVPARRRHRHVLLPPPRPQRGGRAGVHAAAAVRGDRAAARASATAISSTCWRWAASRAEEADAHRRSERREQLEAGAVAWPAATTYVRQSDTLGGVWKGYVGGPSRTSPTSPTRRRRASGWRELLERLTRAARRTSTRIRKIERVPRSAPRDGRRRAAARLGGGRGAGLGQPGRPQGIRVRLSGQDTQRGTFSQRHAVLHDYAGRPHATCRLQHLSPGPGAGRDHQQPAVGGGRAGLRVRLQPRLPRRAGGCGRPSSATSSTRRR